MQAGFLAYSYATDHHSLALSGLRQEVDELKLSKKNKDTINSQLEKNMAKMSADIAELKQHQGGTVSLFLASIG